MVSDAGAALKMLLDVATEWKTAGKLRDWSGWAKECQGRKKTMKRKTHFDQVPLKPQRVYEEMNKAFGRDTTYVTTIGLSQIAGAQFLHVYKPRNWINCGQAGPLGWTIPAALGVRAADPTRNIVALSGDYDFQFMIEELAVGAQFKLPYLHILVNNSYLGLIRQAQRGFEMDYCVQLGFDNVNAPETGGYGVDHMKVVEGLGCKGIRVQRQEEIDPAIEQAGRWMAEHRVPVVVEIMLERVEILKDGASAPGSNSTMASISVPMAMFVTRSRITSMTTGTRCSAIQASACATAGANSSGRCTRIALQPSPSTTFTWSTP